MGPDLQALNNKVDELQTALNVEQEQVANLLAEKNSTIETLTSVNEDLRGQLADGGTPEQRQAVLDKLEAALTDLKSTIPDVQESQPDESQPGE